ncbi:MAG: transposase [Acetatifactor sp.]|nr:transposase [Acetatifactor sp.]
MDDFAIRKRFSYGTVMVDLETHRIIDMIPSRDVAEVENWLREYPNVEVVSRDGAQIYASAVREVHPNARQVSDRFHIIKGLSEAMEKYVIRTYPAKIEIPAVTVQSEEMKRLLNINNRKQRILFAHEQKQLGLTNQEIAMLLHSSLKTIDKYLNIDPTTISDGGDILCEARHKLALEQKRMDVEEARQMSRAGTPVEQIAKQLHRTPETIKRYLNPEYNCQNGHYHMRIPGKLAPYESKVLELRSKGITYQEIHSIISAEGYRGSVASLRMFIQKERYRNTLEQSPDDACSDYQPKEYIQQKSITQLIYSRIDCVYSISNAQFKKVLETYPMLATLYNLRNEFFEIVYSKKPNQLENWIGKLRDVNITELNTYVNGISKDIEAVKNGIALAYNNGLAEGSVNKISKRKVLG